MPGLEYSLSLNTISLTINIASEVETISLKQTKWITVSLNVVSYLVSSI